MSEKLSSTLVREPARLVVRTMQADDYPRLTELWNRAGCAMRAGPDDLAAIALFLGRNPDLSTVAEHEDQFIGALLCGEDGRAGFIHRVTVHPECDRAEVLSAMVRRCLLKLRALGLTRCYLVCDGGAFSVEIGRSASSGLGDAVEMLADAALRLVSRTPAEPPGKSALACEIITPRKKK
ncbi:MAG: GNAT family N-acetyltransferase [Opitutaceae bacterium]